jgi:uroporphyrinogen-III synthase
VIGTVGRTSEGAVLRSIPGAAAAKRISPDDTDDQDSGSEAFWGALMRAGLQPRRVLLLRAEGGRKWLAERLIAAGAEVTPLAVYSRRPLVASEDQLGTLRRWFHSARPPATLVTSSEAIDVLVQQVGRLARESEGVFEWLCGGFALATHARIGGRLRAMGFDRVVLVAPQAESILAALNAQVESR